jgi:uncharacterized protein (DUF934 family)
MALIKNNALIEDIYSNVADGESVPAQGAVIVGVTQWLADREQLLQRNSSLGVRLKSNETPEQIADDLARLDVIALEFPVFRDGRAYSHARILRERYGYKGEIRAVGDVLMEQLFYMLRTGFDAFEIAGGDPLGQFEIALKDFSVWYQPAADERATAIQLRHHRS